MPATSVRFTAAMRQSVSVHERNPAEATAFMPLPRMTSTMRKSGRAAPGMVPMEGNAAEPVNAPMRCARPTPLTAKPPEKAPSGTPSGGFVSPRPRVSSGPLGGVVTKLRGPHGIDVVRASGRESAHGWAVTVHAARCHGLRGGRLWKLAR